MSDMKIGLENATTDNFNTNPIDKSLKSYNKYKFASTTPLVNGGSWNHKVRSVKELSKLADAQEALLKEGRATQRSGTRNLFNDKFSRIHRLSPKHQEQFFNYRKSMKQKRMDDYIKSRIGPINIDAKAEADKITDEVNRRLENAAKAEAKAAKKKSIILKNARIKNLKTAGKVALGATALAGLGYGGYKLYQYQHNKNKEKE